MLGFLVRWWVNIIALLAVVQLVPGIRVDKFQTALWAALVLGLVNAIVRPLAVFLTLPLTIFSLGFSTLVINGLLFYSVSKIVTGFVIQGFWSAFWGALLFSIFSFILSLLLNPASNRLHIRRYHKGGNNKNRPKRDNVIDVEGHVEDKKEDLK